MGRFDALTNKNEKQEKHTSSSAVFSPTPSKVDIENHVQHTLNKDHEIMNSGFHEITPLPDPCPEKPMKYSTLINASLVKKIKMHAAERELKDYEVIELALTAYFDRHRSS